MTPTKSPICYRRPLVLTAILLGCIALAGAAVLWTQRSTGALVASAGIFEWFQKPAALRFHGKNDRTYIGWVGHSGQIHMRTYDHGTGAWQPVRTLVDLSRAYGRAAVDDHNAPSLLMLPSGRMLAFSAVHDTKDAMGVQIMTSPEDTSSWSSWTPIYANTDQEYDYPQAKLLPNGKVVLFFRIGTWKNAVEAYAVSSDEGRTWSAPTTLISFGSGVGVYAFVAQRNDTLAVAWSERLNNDRPSGAFFATSPDGGVSWATAGGKKLPLPITAATAETIIPADEPLFLWDALIDGSGVPHIAYARGLGGSYRYGVARYERDRWTIENVAPASLLYGGTNYYAGGIVFDPNDSDRVLLSTGNWNMELSTWVRSSGRWRHESAITRWSLTDNFRPQYILNDAGGHVVWSAGRYDGFQDGEWSGFDRVNIRTSLPETKPAG